MMWKLIFLFLPVVYMRDCRRPVAKDPGLDVHGSCFGVSHGHIYYPLQAFTFITCKEETQIQGQSKDTFNKQLSQQKNAQIMVFYV